MTAFAAAMIRAGGPSANEAEFSVAIAKFQNNGGSYERALALLAAAYGKGSEGQCMRAIDGHRIDAGASRIPETGDGQPTIADKAKAHVPPPVSPASIAEGLNIFADEAINQMPSGDATIRDGAGRKGVAEKANALVPRPVSPAYREAAFAEARIAARSALDSFKVRDGRAIGDLILGELEGLRFDNAREASVIRQIQRHAGNATANQCVREVIKASDLDRFIQRAAEVADAQ